MYKNLFKPIKIRGLELKNRIIYPGMGTRMGEEDGFANEKLKHYQVERALGGSGLNYLEVNSVHGPSAPKGFLSLSDDKYIPKLREITDAVHEAGGKIGVQLWQGSLAVASDPDAEIIIPSDMGEMGITLKAASIEKIEEVIEAYGFAARRAVEAGFDIVEIHAAHNYSPHMFLSPYFNKREDHYGGDYEGRTRYLFSIIKEVRKNIPEDMPISMRVVAHDDYLEGGLTIEDTIKYVKDAKKLGVDVLNVSRGNIVSSGIKYEVPPLDLDRGFNVENAKKIKEETGIIVQAVGRINNPKLADDIIRDGLDLVTIGRGQMVDPEFANKSKESRVGDIVRCLGCNQGCFDGFVDESFEHISCVRNPAVGHELKYKYEKTSSPKKIAIIGGGIAGLEAAYYLKDRGHSVSVFEKTDKLGGKMLLAGLAPNKEELTASARFRAMKCKEIGVDLRLESDFLEAEDREEFQVGIIATGSRPKDLEVKGSEDLKILYGEDVISRKEKVSGRLLVVGAGIVGTELALILNKEVENITILEKTDKIASKLGQLREIAVLEKLGAIDNLDIVKEAEIMELKENRAIYSQGGKKSELEFDHLVVAIGYESNDYKDLKEYFEINNLDYFVIGDALSPRGILEAFHEGIDTAIFKIE